MKELLHGTIMHPDGKCLFFFFFVGLDVCVVPSDFMLVKDKGLKAPRLMRDNHISGGNSTTNFSTRIFFLSHVCFEE